jgi:hypothetical protein
LKKAVAIFLLFLFLFPTFGKVWIIISFKINQDYIAKNLCVQRNVKNNCCHGCCQLKKRLAENDKQEQKQLPTSSNEKNTFVTDYFCKEIIQTLYISSLKKYNFNNYVYSLPNASLDSVFRPPKNFKSDNYLIS